MIGPQTRHWLVDAGIGAFAGGIIGLILAVNVVIYAGPDQGYESSINDVFEHSIITGLAAIALVIAGPIVGIVIARRLRNQRRRVN